MQSASTETAVPPTQLLDLPNHLLLEVLGRLNSTLSLCSAARTSHLLHRLAASPCLWPHADRRDWMLTEDIRSTLARILHLPPQVFNVQVDARRSRRWPVSVPLHNLRPILCTSDAEGLADRASRALQEQLQRLVLWRHDDWRDLPPAASISVCRADRACIRASLRPQAVVPRLVDHLQQLGWPPPCQPTACPDVATSSSHEAAHSSTMCSVSAASSTGGDGDGISGSSGGGGKNAPQVSIPATSLATHTTTDGSRTCGSSDGCCSHGWQQQISALAADVVCLCERRLALLCCGQLPQLSLMRWGPSVAGPGSNATSVSSSDAGTGAGPGSSWHVNKAALVAAAAKMPHESVARDTACSMLKGMGLPLARAELLADLSVRLLWAAAMADPSSLSFSQPGWMQPLRHATKAASRLDALIRACSMGADEQPRQQQLQQPPSSQLADATGLGPCPCGAACCYRCAGINQQLSAAVLAPALLQRLNACAQNMVGACWSSAGAAELQLCLSGLHDTVQAIGATCDSGSSPLALYRCLVSLDAVAGEYTAALGGSRLSELVGVSARLGGGVSGTAASQSPVRLAMHVELLRAYTWCLWLLGVLG